MKIPTALSILLALPAIQAFSFPRSHPSRFNEDATLDNLRRSAQEGHLAARAPQGPYSNPGEFIDPDLSRVNPDNKPRSGYGSASPPHGTGVPSGTGHPGSPKHSGHPSQPGSPNHPGPPSPPESPNHPGSPSPPESPNHPGSPSPPESPNHPGSPSPPESPGHPGSPAPPSNPENSNPSTPGNPSNPNQPGSPSQPQPPSPSNLIVTLPNTTYHSPIKREHHGAYLPEDAYRKEETIIADDKGEEHVAMHHNGTHHHHPSGTGHHSGGYPYPTGRHHRGSHGGYPGPTGTGHVPHPTGGRFVRAGFTGPKMGRPKVVKEEDEMGKVKEKKVLGRWVEGWLSGLV